MVMTEATIERLRAVHQPIQLAGLLISEEVAREMRLEEMPVRTVDVTRPPRRGRPIPCLEARALAIVERYESFLKQDELGIWTAPGGTRVAWFKDPDGNLLSISQH